MIRTATVALVDRDGEDCERCQLEGNVIAVQIYFYDGAEVMEDCCFSCATPLLHDLEHIAQGHIMVEISEYQLTHVQKEEAA